MSFSITEVDNKLKIVYLRDLDDGSLTITNNAEVVWLSMHYHYPGYIVVYRDTNNELWALRPTVKSMQFDRWLGYDWFVLNK